MNPPVTTAVDLRAIALKRGRSGPVRRLGRSLKQVLLAAPGRIRKAAVRAAYHLPGLSRHDPRRFVVRFRDRCRPVDRIPTGGGAGDWYLPVRPPETLERAESVTLDESQAALFRAGAQRYQSGRRIELPEVFVAGLDHGRIWSRDFLLLSRENRILFESALSSNDVLEANGILDTLVRPGPRRLPGEHWVLANRSTRGYYHWLIDVLPKLSLIEACGPLREAPLIVPAALNRFQQDSLDLAGVPSGRLTGIDPGYWEADRLYFPEILAPWGSVSPHAVAWLRHRFLGGAAAPAAAGRRLYLTRRDAAQRRVLNEPEIIACLEREGFEVLCPGELSFAGQIAAFRAAEVVVAPHGAGATNMVFAPAGATLIELFGDNYVNGCFWALANVCGQRHACVIGPSTWLDYRTDPEHLRRLLDQVL